MDRARDGEQRGQRRLGRQDRPETSLWQENAHGVDNPSGGGVECTNAMCASCMGAPCFQVEYDGVFDLT